MRLKKGDLLEELGLKDYYEARYWLVVKKFIKDRKIFYELYCANPEQRAIEPQATITKLVKKTKSLKLIQRINDD